METVSIPRKDVIELAKLAAELEDRLESLELMSNPEVMESHKRAKEQIKNREFANWDDL
ncbi:MAG: hypothetical protein KKF39_00305 [Nanoarchaeota archaeon]|nr:hypothetical protein [Nanoarchaeota archaeon]